MVIYIPAADEPEPESSASKTKGKKAPAVDAAPDVQEADS